VRISYPTARKLTRLSGTSSDHAVRVRRIGIRHPRVLRGSWAWVEAGGVYAVANLRGGGRGGEERESWHRAGMLGEKQRTCRRPHAGRRMDDSRNGDGPLPNSRSQAGVNGGLLVGAARTTPDLYACVVCSAPMLKWSGTNSSASARPGNSEYGHAADHEQLGWRR